MIDQKRREIFVNYLLKLSEGDSYSEDWRKTIIEHYRDEKLEEVRRNVVRLRIRAGDPEIFPTDNEQKEQLLKWAKELQ